MKNKDCYQKLRDLRNKNNISYEKIAKYFNKKPDDIFY